MPVLSQIRLRQLVRSKSSYRTFILIKRVFLYQKILDSVLTTFTRIKSNNRSVVEINIFSGD